MAWTVNVGQGTGIRSLKRISNITVVEEWAHSNFSVTIQNPTAEDRNQAKGRIDDAIIQIKRGSEILLEGYIEDVEKGPNYVKYTGRSFLILLGYSTSSETDKTTQETKAEYTNEYAKDIIKDLIKNYCYTKDSELTYTDIDFTDDDGLDIEYKGTLKLHGKKVYDIICDMCNMYAKDIWSDATWNGDNDNVINKNIHIGIKGNGDSENPHKKLYAGIHFKEMPVVKYRTQGDMINCLRVIGKGTGKDRISVWCEDSESITNYGYIEGQPYISNLIVDKDTATKVGNAIINDKKELVELRSSIEAEIASTAPVVTPDGDTTTVTSDVVTPNMDINVDNSAQAALNLEVSPDDIASKYSELGKAMAAAWVEDKS